MRPKRALWLLNHTTLRQFEVPMLRALGYEVFTPKRFPSTEDNASASVTDEFDESLTVSPEDLAALNAHDFYGQLTPEIAGIINRHFDTAFFGFFPSQLQSLSRNFRGILVVRPFGAAGMTYTDITSKELGRFFLPKLERIEPRFWFGQAYENLAEVETGIYQRKAVYLPVALASPSSKQAWTGNDARLLFVCPRIGTSSYYRGVYDDFRKSFGDLPHVICGAQPIAVSDPNVTGFLPRSAYDGLMQNARVMYYHSRESHHLHYHPLEAVQSGMPLIFMAGGMLDELGGKELPGRCETVGEARSKVEKVLNNDRGFIRRILDTQPRLLESFDPRRCADVWRNGIQRIETESTRSSSSTITRKSRIAVIVPIEYRGGSMRGAKLLATSIDQGARDAGASVEVVFAHLDDPAYEDSEFDDLPDTVERRTFEWRIIPRDEALRAITYAGLEQPLHHPTYMFPDDGVRQFLDCDLLVVVSDRLRYPLLPVRPYMLMVYDYLQRYEKFLTEALNRSFIQRAHDAEAILVTTDFTMRDAVQFAGVPQAKVRKMPIVAPDFSRDMERYKPSGDRPDYFIWTTNVALHKNHENAFKALRLYYEHHDGQFECRITGAGVGSMLETTQIPHLLAVQKIVSSSPALKRKVKALGELRDDSYRSTLANAAWLWHAARIDNGTFAVIEAAHVGVPSLSSRYPAMQEIDRLFSLNLAWMDPWDPHDMARQLKAMEGEFETRRGLLPSSDQLASRSTDAAGDYWQAIRDYL